VPPSDHLPPLDRRLATVLRTFVKELNLTPRMYARIIIVARRIADWAHAEKIQAPHLMEAIQFCTLDGDSGRG
jgi:magnesium chelatase family protein